MYINYLPHMYKNSVTNSRISYSSTPGDLPTGTPGGSRGGKPAPVDPHTGGDQDIPKICSRHAKICPIYTQNMLKTY